MQRGPAAWPAGTGPHCWQQPGCPPTCPQVRPSHTLLAADFDQLPEVSIPGVCAPLAATTVRRAEGLERGMAGLAAALSGAWPPPLAWRRAQHGSAGPLSRLGPPCSHPSLHARRRWAGLQWTTPRTWYRAVPPTSSSQPTLACCPACTAIPWPSKGAPALGVAAVAAAPPRQQRWQQQARQRQQNPAAARWR